MMRSFSLNCSLPRSVSYDQQERGPLTVFIPLEPLLFLAFNITLSFVVVSHLPRALSGYLKLLERLSEGRDL